MSMSKRRIATVALLAAALASVGAASHVSAGDEVSIGAAVVIIELTDNDIELQVFADAFDWVRLEIEDPNGRRMFLTRAQGRLVRQNGMSEMFWASEPTHYLEDEPNFDGPIEEFLETFPEGVYEFEATKLDGTEIVGEAILTHILPALPEIVAPLSDDDTPPVIDPNDVLVIDWEPVTTQFDNPGPVEIFEYQVIIDQADPERDTPWVDGGTRRALINLPPDVTELTVPPEFLLPGSSYEFEILAIEVSGNSTISVGEFDTSE